jgi:ABC-type amino acid transport substrate-binding protein
LSERARTALDAVQKLEDRGTIDGALAQLEINPKDLKFWTSKHDPSGMYIYAGKDDCWVISFGILDEARVVYVHAIKPRPSYGFDPRRRDD